MWQYIKQMSKLAVCVILAPFLFLALFPLAIVFMIPFSIALFLWGWIAENLFTLAMMRKRRFVPWFKLGNLKAGDRLIVESPTLGWGTTRLWYVPGQAIASCPFPAPQNNARSEVRNKDADLLAVHPFDEWVFEHILAEDTGMAILIRAWNGGRLKGYLLARHPELSALEIWSAPAALKRFESRKQESLATPNDGLKAS